MTGFDAYERAWDIVTKDFWQVLAFNLSWLLFAFLVFLASFALAALVVGSQHWGPVLILAILVPSVLIGPLWEASNITRFLRTRDCVPFLRLLCARLAFLVVVTPAYLLFLVPGIYLHCRLCLYLPLLVAHSDISWGQSLARSWNVTRGHFVGMYTLWITLSASKPIALLPLGLGLILERPLAGLTKALVLQDYGRIEGDYIVTYHARDGPI